MSLKHYRDKTVGIFGLGLTGLSLIEKLKDKCKTLIAWDDNIEKHKSINSSVKILPINDKAWQSIDILYLSPGIPLNYPEPHPVVNLARKNGCPIVCDVELLYQLNSSATFIGITGTNGKSTTTALISHILKTNDVRCEVGGNIGKPVLELNELGKDGAYVIEMSSYQLELVHNTHFNIAVYLNLTPDHLDRHSDMEGYHKAKMNIFNHSSLPDVAIINFDDKYTKSCYQELKGIRRIIPFSTNYFLSTGISLMDNTLFFNQKEYYLGRIKTLLGKHNAENIAAAFAACVVRGLEPENIITAIKAYPGLPHRMEYLGEKNGVTYINDSKGTNPEATEKALKSFQNIHWIAGGVSKAQGIKPLLPYLDRVKKVYLIGKAQEEFAADLEGRAIFEKCNNLELAFLKASQSSCCGEVVLLSPACASFDQWKNFEERGNFFRELFDKLES